MNWRESEERDRWVDSVTSALQHTAIHFEINLTQQQIDIYLEFLCKYPDNQICDALERCRTELNEMPVIAHVIERLPKLHHIEAWKNEDDAFVAFGYFTDGEIQGVTPCRCVVGDSQEFDVMVFALRDHGHKVEIVSLPTSHEDWQAVCVAEKWLKPPAQEQACAKYFRRCED